MAFNAKNTVIGNTLVQQPVQNNNTPTQYSELELSELEFLLKMLGNADLKGHQVEMFYNLIIKLQNNFLQKNKIFLISLKIKKINFNSSIAGSNNS